MESHIYYNGFNLNSFSLVKYKNATSGRFVTKPIDQTFHVSAKTENGTPFRCNIELELEAYDKVESKENLAYVLKLNMDVLFNLSDSNLEFTSELIQKNSWLINRYVHTSAKLAAEGLLKNTAMHKVNLPWS